MESYGNKLNPYRRVKHPMGIKGVRQSVVITNNPSVIDQNQILQVRFPNLGEHDVIVPGTARLSFTVSLDSTDANRTLVQNVGQSMISKTTIKISGNEVTTVDNCNVFNCYADMWKTESERDNAQYQGIDTSTNRNATKLRIGAGDMNPSVVIDSAISEAYGNRFYHPLNFELLETSMPFYQSALGDRLEYELTFNEYSKTILSTDTNSKYSVSNICLEYDMVTDMELAEQIASQYDDKIAIYYDRILRHRVISAHKLDTLWNINLNVPARSMKGVLMLFKERESGFAVDTEKFYNPKITKAEVTIEGIPNQLYAQGMRPYQQWDETRKFFSGGQKKDKMVNYIAKSLELADVSLGEYLTDKYALWLDMRTVDDDCLHGSGRRVDNASEGITIQLTKEAVSDAPGELDIYLYVVMDSQLNIENRRFKNVLY